MNRIKASVISYVMKRYGISANMSYKLYSRIVDDFKVNNAYSLKEKLWSYRRGFFMFSTKAFALTEQNYKHYLSDVDYYRLYPVDKHYRHWIDDKLTMKVVLSPFSDYLPKYFCEIRMGGVITPLIDGKDICDMDELLHCIKQEKKIALKLATGSHGVGFYKLTYSDHFEINNQPVPEDKCIEFLKNIEGYLVTEYVEAHEDIKIISNGALSTVRVMVINEDSKHPKIANAVMKFSTTQSGQVDNIKAGGIFANVDLSTGAYSDARRIDKDDVISCNIHPDSNLEIKGTLPNWHLICEKLVEISQSLVPLTYLGYDIAITNDRFKIIEINSHQGLMMFQVYSPLLKDNIATDFLLRRLNDKKR